MLFRQEVVHTGDNEGIAYSIDSIRTALSESGYSTSDDNVFKVHRGLLEGTMLIGEDGKITKA